MNNFCNGNFECIFFFSLLNTQGGTLKGGNASVYTRSDGLHISVTPTLVTHLGWMQQNQEYKNAGCMNNFWSHCIWFNAARRADSEYHLYFSWKWSPIYKNWDLEAKTSVFQRPAAPAVFISTWCRYDQRWPRCRRIIAESLRSIALKLCRGTQNRGTVVYQNLAGFKTRFLVFRIILCYIPFIAARHADSENPLGLEPEGLYILKISDFGEETRIFRKPVICPPSIYSRWRYAQR